ncbi:hypothetical protein ABZ341_40390 [Streptomyces sp. NPDC006173]|uniref:hypothetical protein n=1 Tax=Streptomyces sp. NPDC006173 TaxID=3155349 RepID=UPI0033EA5E0A
MRDNTVAALSEQPTVAAALRERRLEGLRRTYEQEIVTSVRRTVRVVPYALASSAEERGADHELIAAHVRATGWQVSRATFWDGGQAPPLTERAGFGNAFRYATQGFAHGIVAISRAAIATDDTTYEYVLDELRAHGVFLTFLPADDD